MAWEPTGSNLFSGNFEMSERMKATVSIDDICPRYELEPPRGTKPAAPPIYLASVYQCESIGLTTGQLVTGWALFRGDRPPTQDPYAFSFSIQDVVDYRFDLGNVVLDSSNTDIQRWILSTFPPDMTFTGGDLIGFVDLTWKGTDVRAFDMFDDSDVYWYTYPVGNTSSGLGDQYLAGGPAPRPASESYFLGYPGGWHFESVIPEPGTVSLIAVGLVGAWISRRRRKCVIVRA